MEQKSFSVSENGFAIDGSGTVSIPACKIKAASFIEASQKLSAFLKTRKLDPDIELITPMEKISFD